MTTTTLTTQTTDELIIELADIETTIDDLRDRQRQIEAEIERREASSLTVFLVEDDEPREPQNDAERLYVFVAHEFAVCDTDVAAEFGISREEARRRLYAEPKFSDCVPDRKRVWQVWGDMQHASVDAILAYYRGEGENPSC